MPGSANVQSFTTKVHTMSNTTPSAWRDWLLPGGVLALVVAAVAGSYVWRAPQEAPRECGLTPSALHDGTFLNWRLSMAPGEGLSGEVSAAVRLDDGREIIAYNVTNAAGLSPNDRVVVSEIQCVHRKVFLLSTAGGAQAPATN